MTVLDKIKSLFKRSEPQAKAEETKPAAKGAEGEAIKAPENKAASEQKGGGGA